MSWGAFLTIAALLIATFLRIRHEAREILDVVGHDRTAVFLCTLEDDIVGHAPVSVRELGRGDDVDATSSQLPRDLGRPHLVQQQLHATAASSRAARSVSAAIRASISSR